MNLTNKIIEGNHLAFEMVYDKFFHKLVAFINSYTNNIEESKDIAQNSLVVFWEKREQLKPGLAIEPYLFTIAKNAALDYLRSFKVRLNHAQNVLSEHERMICELNEVSLELFDVEKLKANVLKKKIFKVLLSLPIGDRRIFILSRFNNLTNNEIAQVLKISPKTVEKRISLTLKILRKNIYMFDNPKEPVPTDAVYKKFLAVSCPHNIGSLCYDGTSMLFFLFNFHRPIGA